MSTYHYIYAEANVNGKWYSLNPVMPLANGGYGSGAIIYLGGSFHPEVFHWLRKNAISSGLPDDISNTTKEHFPGDMDELTKCWLSEMTNREYYKRTAFVVNFDTTIVRKIRKDRPYKYMAYIPRETLASFECGEIDEIENWITPNEFNTLLPEEKEGYIYYEWNNWHDEYGIYQDIANKVYAQMSWFSEIDGVLDSRSHSTYNQLTPGQVRLIVYTC